MTTITGSSKITCRRYGANHTANTREEQSAQRSGDEVLPPLLFGADDKQRGTKSLALDTTNVCVAQSIPVKGKVLQLRRYTSEEEKGLAESTTQERLSKGEG